MIPNTMNQEQNEDEVAKLLLYDAMKLDPTKMLLLHIFLGWSYGSMGQTGTQVLFYCTLGGLGVWSLIRCFTVSKDVKAYNRQKALEVGIRQSEFLKLGLI